MKIKLNYPHMSIATLETEELPDFAILIGRNGAGKTQLLDALKGGMAVIPDIDPDEIEQYDMGTFRSPNAGAANRHANQFAKMTVNAYLLSEPGSRPLIEEAEAVFEKYASAIERDSGAKASEDFEFNLRDEIRRTPDFSVFAENHQRPSYKQTIYEQVFAPLVPVQPRPQQTQPPNQYKTSFGNNQAALLSAAMKLNGKLPHELTQDDIMRAAGYEGGTLSNSLSAVFAAYKVDQFIWAHKRIETERVDFAELITQYRTTNPPPWETLRGILSSMREAAGDDGLFDFDFSDPDEYHLDMGNYEQFTFKAEMTNRTTGAQYELNSLSSGEMVLMALCLASFNQYLGRRVPKLLLLDELDAVLHPSMVAALVATLKNLFVPKGTKVLMTSHSPMTVAVLDEADIFRVVRTYGHVKVSKTTKSEAINELSEGLATVDVGLRIAASNEAKVTILTEGHNTKHLKRWVELNFPGEVHVFEGLEQHTNNDQLLFYGRLLGRMTTNTHFVIVWDCDAKGKAETLRGELSSAAKVKAYAFKKRLDNTIADSGIENIYEEEILEPYTNTVMNHEGALVARSFQNNRKTEFANQVLQHGTAEYFTHCQDLHDIISGILGSTPAATLPECEEESVGLTNGEKPELPTNAPFIGEVTAV